MRILNRSLPIFIRSLLLCCVARQTCRIIGNEKNNNTIFEKCGTSADFAGHLMKMRDCPSGCGTVDTYVVLVFPTWSSCFQCDPRVSNVVSCFQCGLVFPVWSHVSNVVSCSQCGLVFSMWSSCFQCGLVFPMWFLCFQCGPCVPNEVLVFPMWSSCSQRVLLFIPIFILTSKFCNSNR